MVGHLPLITRPLFLCLHVSFSWSKTKAFLESAGEAGARGIHRLASSMALVWLGFIARFVHSFGSFR